MLFTVNLALSENQELNIHVIKERLTFIGTEVILVDYWV
jgi:hypothetical protein